MLCFMLKLVAANPTKSSNQKHPRRKTLPQLQELHVLSHVPELVQVLWLPGGLFSWAGLGKVFAWEKFSNRGLLRVVE